LNIGGPAIQAINLSRDLNAEGFETCLIHGRLGPGEGDMTRLLPLDGTKALYLDTLVRPISPIRDLRALWSIYQALLQWKPQVIHTHMAKAGTLGRLAGVAYNWTSRRSQRAKIVHTYHGHVFEGYFDELSTRVFLMVERWLARRTDTLIGISSQVMKDLVTTYRIGNPRTARLIPLGFDLERLLAVTAFDLEEARSRLGISRDALVVTTVGRLTAIKQHSLFLQMAQRVARKSSQVVFLIVGDGELRGRLEQEAKQLGVGHQVQFLGWRGDLETIYAATSVFVLTSRNEGTPVALIEAMAAGVASVATDVGGVRDVIARPQVGLLVPPGNADAVASAVIELVEDPVRRQEMGRHARAFVRGRFQRARLIGDIVRLYDDLLAHTRSA
jgi:glycosyltransferase involved in cell wall biosynthesis